MAVKLKKYPKKPKSSASTGVMERYVKRCKEIDKENKRIKADAKKRESLKKKISAIGRSK